MMQAAMDSALSAAQAAGEVLRDAWQDLLQVEKKSHRSDLVTNADVSSERTILSLLRERHPDYGILAEESGSQSSDAEWLWVVDPLDGTTNYVHRLPLVAISIGLLHKGNPVLGVVYNPITQDLFSARKGQGAYHNGQPISVSETAELADSLLVTGFAYDRTETEDNNYLEFCALTHQTHGVRRLGAASLDLAFVACGRFDGYWERGLSPWDLAAGALLVEEAGGRVSAYDSSPFDLYSGRILATNGQIHTELSGRLGELAVRRLAQPITGLVVD